MTQPGITVLLIIWAGLLSVNSSGQSLDARRVAGFAEGVHYIEGQVLVVAEVPLSSKSAQRLSYREGDGMLRNRDLLFKALSSAPRVDHTPASPNAFSQSLPLVSQILTSLEESDSLSLNYTARVVENWEKGSVYRYTTSMSLAEYDRLVRIVQESKKEPDMESALNVIGNKYRQLLLRSSAEELADLFQQMGCPMTAVAYSNRVAENKHSLYNCCVASNIQPPHWLSAAINLTDTNEGELYTLLKVYPNHPVLHRKLVSISKNPTEKFNYLLLLRVTGHELEKTDRELNTLAKTQMAEIPEFSLLIKQMLQDFPSGASEGRLDDALWLTDPIRFKIFNFCPELPSGETSSYRSALKKFQLGADLAEVRQLLRAAIQESPNHAEAWNLLSACYRASGQHMEAVNTACQALRINPEHGRAELQLALSLSELGYHQLSLYHAFAALIKNKEDEWISRTATELINSSIK